MQNAKEFNISFEQWEEVCRTFKRNQDVAIAKLMEIIEISGIEGKQETAMKSTVKEIVHYMIDTSTEQLWEFVPRKEKDEMSIV